MMSFSRHEHSVSGPHELHLPQNTLIQPQLWLARVVDSHFCLMNLLLYCSLTWILTLLKEGNTLTAGMSLANCFTEASVGNYSVVMQSANSFTENLKEDGAVG